MSANEQALRFECGTDALYGVLHRPVQAHRQGVVFVVGGPQYRAGSHRQFVLLARALANHGIAALRFDARGMGDSEGEPAAFDQRTDDLRAAIDAMQLHLPQLDSVILWGLCDGATAAALYAASDARVTGLVLVNPWAHTETGAAAALLRHHYLKRLADAEFWRKLTRGQVDWPAARRGLSSALRSARGGAAAVPGNLPERMRERLSCFRGRLLLILSGADLTAREFADLAAGCRHWRALLAQPRVQRRDLPDANHTVARRVWRDQVANWTSQWVREA